jgi:hypothetical protein
MANGDEELDPTKVQQVAQETAEKCSITQTYLGADPDSSESIEFVCLVEGDEVTLYEVLSAITKKLTARFL